jgi:hypothetical protein
MPYPTEKDGVGTTTTTTATPTTTIVPPYLLLPSKEFYLVLYL